METPDLSDFCRTKSQARDFSARLTEIATLVFHTNFNLEHALLEAFGLQKKDKFMALLRTYKVQPVPGAALKGFLEKLAATTNALPVLSLSLAFEPKEATLKVLSDWFLLNIQRQVLFDISVDPTLVAGVTINFNGRHLDFTVKETFARVLKETIMSEARPPQAPPHPVRQQVTHQNVENLSLGR